MDTTAQLGNDALALIGITFAFLLAISIRRRREAIRYRVRLAILAEAAFLGVTYLLVQSQHPMAMSVLGGVVAGAIVIQFARPRSRYISAAVRRRAVAKWELKTGRKFNSRKNELDHDVPFARGGSNTHDNIRVSTRKQNRSKSAKSPWWDVLGR